MDIHVVTVAQPLSLKHVTFALFWTDRDLHISNCLEYASCILVFHPHLIVFCPSILSPTTIPILG